MKKVIPVTIRMMMKVAEVLFEMISVVCVGSVIAEGTAKFVWKQAIDKLFALLAILFPVFQFRFIAELDSGCHFYPEGKGLTLALIAQSIQPRAPNF